MLTDKPKQHKQEKQKNKSYIRYSPTRPNKTQYTAANMVKGIDANKAPNFPAKGDHEVILDT